MRTASDFGWQREKNKYYILYTVELFKGTVLRDFPKPLGIPVGPFRMFSKIRGDIRSSSALIYRRCRWYRWFNLTCEDLDEFSK
jgi:hypothetical protein